MLVQALDVGLVWELITEEETLQNENPKKKKTLPLGLFTHLFFTNASLSCYSSTQWLGQTSSLVVGNVIGVKIISSGWWWIERGGSRSAWTFHRRADFFYRLQIAKKTPKDYLSRSNNCSTTSNYRIPAELIKHNNRDKLPPFSSELF